MVEALAVLTNIAIVLLSGLIVTIISKKFAVSNVLLLIILGMLLKTLKYHGSPIFEFSSTFLISISILALVMITFDGTSRFKIKEVDRFSGDSLRIVAWFIIANILLITTFTNIMFFPDFSLKYIVFSLMFAVIMAGTDPGAIFSMMKGRMVKAIEVLEIEAIINTPIIVIMPFILLDFLTVSGSNEIVQSFIDQTIPFLRQIIVGVGTGVVIGIMIFKAMKKVYHHQLSPLAIIIAALLSYVLAENLGGNGVLSVATMGLVFGNIYIRRKITLQAFSSIFSNALEILVFVFIGFLVTLELSSGFILKSLLLFIIMIIARWLAITTALRKSNYKLREKIFMTLNMPKGIAVAVVVFSLSVKNIPEIEIVINLILVFMIFSLILSSIIDRYSKKFINIDLED